MPITAAPFDDAGLFRALRATSTIQPVPRGLPMLFALPGMAATPWLFSCLGRMLLGVLLSRREPWSERLGLLTRGAEGRAAGQASPRLMLPPVRVMVWQTALRCSSGHACRSHLSKHGTPLLNITRAGEKFA
jgi:hypothetical protein